MHYRHVLSELGRQPGTLGTIYRKAQNRIQDPAKLRRLVVNLINEETWTAVDADLKGDAYEELLPEGRGGHQVRRRAVLHPPSADPGDDGLPVPEAAARRSSTRRVGTGGFLLAAHEWVVDHHIETMDADDKRFLRDGTVHGWEIVDGTARLCAMNLLLHGIGTPTGPSLVTVVDALRADPGVRFDMVAANPPFGRKSSMTMVNEAGEVAAGGPGHRPRRLLGHHGEQAAQLPPAHQDDAGHQRPGRRGAARQRAVRGRRRGDDPPPAAGRVRPAHHAAAADRHLLRPGREGQRAVLRPEARRRGPVDQGLWVYDLRTNKHFTLKTKPLRRERPGRLRGRLLPRRTGATRVESERFRRSATTSSSPATRPTSTSPGCATTPSRTAPPCPHPRSSPPRSSRSWRRRWPSSPSWRPRSAPASERPRVNPIRADEGTWGIPSSKASGGILIHPERRIAGGSRFHRWGAPNCNSSRSLSGDVPSGRRA